MSGHGAMTSFAEQHPSGFALNCEYSHFAIQCYNEALFVFRLFMVTVDGTRGAPMGEPEGPGPPHWDLKTQDLDGFFRKNNVIFNFAEYVLKLFFCYLGGPRTQPEEASSMVLPPLENLACAPRPNWHDTTSFDILRTDQWSIKATKALPNQK